METKELLIKFEEFKSMLQRKQSAERQLKGFRKNKAPDLLMSYLYGNKIMEQVIQGKLYEEMTEQIKRGYNIKDFKIEGIKIKNKDSDPHKGWSIVVRLQKEPIKKQSLEKGESKKNNNPSEEETKG